MNLLSSWRTVFILGQGWLQYVASRPMFTIPRCRGKTLPITTLVNNYFGRRYNDDGVLALNWYDSIFIPKHCRVKSRSANGLAFIPESSHSLRARKSIAVAEQRSPQIRRFKQYFSQQAATPPSIRRESYNVNRYERFRQCLTSLSRETLDAPSSFDHDPPNSTYLVDVVGKHAMEVVSSNRRSFNRTWKRMKPLLELTVFACDGKSDGNNVVPNKSGSKISSIADVGCDHGILSLSLACIAWAACQRDANKETILCDGMNRNIETFSRVTGTDVSPMALENGGLVSLKKMMDTMIPIYDSGEPPSLPIEFRVGSGLEPLAAGEADAIVLAGMGVHTQLDILFGNDEGMISSDHPVPVDRVQAQQIFLQPTNSRPQHMIILYDRLQKSGEWVLRDESIAFVGGRWYVNSFFDRRRGDQHELGDSFRSPGHFLVHSDNGSYDSYVEHHLRWLKEDYERPRGLLEDEDRRWLEYILSSEEHGKWKSHASWYLFTDPPK